MVSQKRHGVLKNVSRATRERQTPVLCGRLSLTVDRRLRCSFAGDAIARRARPRSTARYRGCDNTYAIPRVAVLAFPLRRPPSARFLSSVKKAPSTHEGAQYCVQTLGARRKGTLLRGACHGFVVPLQRVRGRAGCLAVCQGNRLPRCARCTEKLGEPYVCSINLCKWSNKMGAGQGQLTRLYLYEGVYAPRCSIAGTHLSSPTSA